MPLLRGLLALAPDERRVLIKATFWVAVVKLGLGRIPFPTLRRLVTGGGRNGARSAGDQAIPEQVAWAVTVVSRYVPGPTTCLSRALTVQGMLARLGYPSRLQACLELLGHWYGHRFGEGLLQGNSAALHLHQCAQLASRVSTHRLYRSGGSATLLRLADLIDEHLGGGDFILTDSPSTAR